MVVEFYVAGSTPLIVGGGEYPVLMEGICIFCFFSGKLPTADTLCMLLHTLQSSRCAAGNDGSDVTQLKRSFE